MVDAARTGGVLEEVCLFYVGLLCSIMRCNVFKPPSRQLLVLDVLAAAEKTEAVCIG